MKLIHAAAIVAYASAVQAFYLRPSARRRTGSAWAELGNSICSTNEGPTVTKTGTKETAPFSSLDSIQSTANGDYFVAVSSQTLSKNFRAQGGVELYHFDRSPCLWKHDTANITGIQTEDRLGYSISLRCDGSALAVSGDISYPERPGFVQVYRRSGNGWVQKGEKILDGLPPLRENSDPDKNFGVHVEMSCNSNADTLVVNANGYFQAYTFKEDSGNYEPEGEPYMVREQLEESEDRDPYYKYPLVSYAVGSLPLRVASRPYEDNKVEILELDVTSGKWEITGTLLQGNTSSTQTTKFSSINDIVITADGSVVAILAGSRVFAFEQTRSKSWIQLGHSIYAGGSASLSISRSLGTRNKNGESNPLRVSLALTSGIQVYEFRNNEEWAQVGSEITADVNSVSRTRYGFSNDGSVVLSISDLGVLQAHFWPADGTIDCYPDFSHPLAQTCFDPPAAEEENSMNVHLTEEDDMGSGINVTWLIIVLVALILFGVFLFFYVNFGTSRKTEQEDVDRHQETIERERLVDNSSSHPTTTREEEEGQIEEGHPPQPKHNRRHRKRKHEKHKRKNDDDQSNNSGTHNEEEEAFGKEFDNVEEDE